MILAVMANLSFGITAPCDECEMADIVFRLFGELTGEFEICDVQLGDDGIDFNLPAQASTVRVPFIGWYVNTYGKCVIVGRDGEIWGDDARYQVELTIGNYGGEWKKYVVWNDWANGYRTVCYVGEADSRCRMVNAPNNNNDPRGDYYGGTGSIRWVGENIESILEKNYGLVFNDLLEWIMFHVFMTGDITGDNYVNFLDLAEWAKSKWPQELWLPLLCDNWLQEVGPWLVCD